MDNQKYFKNNRSGKKFIVVDTFQSDDLSKEEQTIETCYYIKPAGKRNYKYIFESELLSKYTPISADDFFGHSLA